MNRQIEKLYHELSLLGVNFEVDEESKEEVILKCANCNRRVIENCESFYKINLRPIQSNTIKQHSRFRFVRSTRGNTEPIEYQLCEQCEQHLTDSDTDVAKQPRNMWPAFMWNILQSSQIHATYECEFIWKFIPLQWRRWWIDEVHTQFPTFYRNVTLSLPTSIFVDRTNDINTWNNNIDSGKLMTIAEVCNKLLLPTVLCPWGCSEFIHKAGYIDFHIVMQRYISKMILSDIDHVDIAKVDPARDDFCRELLFAYDTWLLNPK